MWVLWPERVGPSFDCALHPCAGGEAQPLLPGSREVRVTPKAWPLRKIPPRTSAPQKCMPVRRSWGFSHPSSPGVPNSQCIAPAPGGSTLAQQHVRPKLSKGLRAPHVGGAREPDCKRSAGPVQHPGEEAAGGAEGGTDGVRGECGTWERGRGTAPETGSGCGQILSQTSAPSKSDSWVQAGAQSQRQARSHTATTGF